jgi:hypothetical protein
MPCGAEAATTAWRVVVATVDQSARLGATGVDCRVEVLDGTMTVDLAVDGVDAAFDLLPVEDRVGALGGRLVTRWTAPTHLALHAELPCA